MLATRRGFVMEMVLILIFLFFREEINSSKHCVLEIYSSFGNRDRLIDGLLFLALEYPLKDHKRRY